MFLIIELFSSTFLLQKNPVSFKMFTDQALSTCLLISFQS